MLKDLLTKRACAILEKKSFQPMPGGQPPADPNAQPPMDPSMMGGGAPGGMPPGGAPGMPMDPSMMGGAPGGMPMDPSMMGGMPMGVGMGQPPPATVGQLSVTDFQTIMTDMLVSVLQQIMGGGAAPEAAAPAPEMAPQENAKPVSNTEISEKLDALVALLSGAAGGAPGAGAPPDMGGGLPGAPMGGAPMGGPEMGFGGQSVGSPMPMAAGPGMEVQGSVKKKASLADMILSKTARARKQE